MTSEALRAAASGVAQDQRRTMTEHGPSLERTIPRRIDACEAHAYHFSDHIQPHGLFFGLDLVSLSVTHVSANAAAILGRGIDTLLAGNFLDLLTDASARHLKDRLVAFGRDAAETSRTSLALALADPAGFTADAILYRSDKLLCVEIEPPSLTAAAGFLPSDYLELAERIFRSEVPSAALPGILCEIIRDVTGADRVYYCLFDQHGHGHVLGESRNDALPELMDHHFPATDVPAVVRRMLILNPYRLIPDVDAPPVAIVGTDGASLNLMMSSCRSVAESHLRYVRNMGVKASFSVPETRDGELQAFLGGHHATPLYLSFRQMATCRLLVELFKGRADFLRAREERAVLAERVDVLQALCRRFQTDGRDLGAFIAAYHQEFRDLIDCDDLICCFDGQSHFGPSVAEEDAADLFDFLGTKLSEGVDLFQSDRIGHEDPRFYRLCPAVAGVLAVSFDLSGRNIIAWLRREAVVTEKWSGDPHLPAPNLGQGPVDPRTSFLDYLRERKGTSRLWPSASIDFAHRLQHDFAQALVSHYEIGMRKAAEQSNASKSEFIANISHELRSPMHAILGFADLLATAREPLSGDKRKRYAGAIQDSGQRLLRLIDDLLNMAQLEAGKMSFSFADEDIRATLESAVAGMSELIRRKQVAILIDDCRAQKRAWFDATRIQQVIINLLSNALKVSPPGGQITVTLGPTLQGPGESRLLIQVADQGVGIPDNELEAVFAKFIQSTRTKTGAGGTGLGLAICRDIIEAHHGRIWAANNATGGASFFIEIPQHAPTGYKATP